METDDYGLGDREENSNKKILAGSIYRICGGSVSVCRGLERVAARGNAGGKKLCLREYYGNRRREKLDKINGLIENYYLYEDEIDADALIEGMYSGTRRRWGTPIQHIMTRKPHRSSWKPQAANSLA